MSIKYESQKVNQKQYRLSKLMKFILTKTGNSVERAELVANYYHMERRYYTFFTDPCFSKREQKRFNRKFNSAQASMTKTLKRLEKAGLVELIRREHYVKHVCLTPNGKELAEAFPDFFLKCNKT